MNSFIALALAQALLEGENALHNGVEGENVLHNGVVREHPAWEKEQLMKAERRGKTPEEIQELRRQKYAERQKEKADEQKDHLPRL